MMQFFALPKLRAGRFRVSLLFSKSGKLSPANDRPPTRSISRRSNLPVFQKLSMSGVLSSGRRDFGGNRGTNRRLAG